MSKITNDGLTWSGTECLIAVPVWQQWTSKICDGLRSAVVVVINVFKYLFVTV